MAVRPGTPLLQQPGGEAGGRVVEPAPDRLRFCRLDRAVPALYSGPLLVLRQVCTRHSGEWGGARAGVRRVVEVRQMDADQRAGIVERHKRGDAGAEVTAVRTVVFVAEPAHEAVPEAGDEPVVDAGSPRPFGEA